MEDSRCSCAVPLTACLFLLQMELVKEREERLTEIDKLSSVVEENGKAISSLQVSCA